jgi:hypothetical protein
MHVFSAPHYLWDELYQTIGDNWRKRSLFKFFSDFNNLLSNHFPYFYRNELALINWMGEFEFDTLDVREYASFVHHLFSLISIETAIFFDLLIWSPSARAFFRAIIQLWIEGQDPFFFNSYSFRSDIFLGDQDRASSLLFTSERSTVETIVYMYNLPYPYYDEKPSDIQICPVSLQWLQDHIEEDNEAEYQGEPYYVHPDFYVPVPAYVYPPGWEWGVDDSPDVYQLSSSIADLSFRPKRR